MAPALLIALYLQPARWGADQVEAFVTVEHEFRAEDRLQFTRKNHCAGRLNGRTVEVVAINPAGSSIVVASDDGRRAMLDMPHLADRHIRHGWVRTIHSAQGAISDRVLAHSRASAPTSSMLAPSM